MALERLINKIILLLLISGAVFAEEFDKDTPIFRRGVFKGQMVDTAIWSHAQEATPEQMTALQKWIPEGKLGDYYIFQNVKHANEYHVAAVPKKVKQVTAYLEELMLGGKVAHGFFGMELESPAILLPKNLQGRPIYVTDMVVSNDAARPVGVGFSPAKGFGPNLILHTNFQTLEQVYIDYDLGNPERANIVAEFPLEIEETRRDRLLKNAIEMSMKNGYDRIYNTLSMRNCCGQLFLLLDSVLPKPSFLGSCRLGLNHVANFLPGLFRDGLRVRNLYNKTTEGKLSHNSRFNSLIQKAMSNDAKFLEAIKNRMYPD